MSKASSKVQFTIRLDNACANRLKRLCGYSGWSQSKLVSELIDERCKGMKLREFLELISMGKRR